MSNMLLEEPAQDRDALDQKQESVLVDIMVCSVKQAAEGCPPSGRQGYNKVIVLLSTLHLCLTLQHYPKYAPLL